MKVLVVKTSSMGDVIHTLPAITDATNCLPGITFDWVVEEAFSEIPPMHPSVRRVVKVAIRRWRRTPGAAASELRNFITDLRSETYDVIIDAQGLVKSAMVAMMARGERVGLDWESAREPLASLAYRHKVHVETGIHAIERVRRLFSVALGYELPVAAADFGLTPAERASGRDVILLHGTTWPSKHWPEPFWVRLAELLLAEGLGVSVAHGNDEEEARALRVAAAVPGVRVLERMGIASLARVLAGSAGVVTVDSGPGHLAAAVGVPLVGLYGPTDPTLTGPYGVRHKILVGDHLPCIPCLARTCSYTGNLPEGTPWPPCFSRLVPERVRDSLLALRQGESA